jgi:hypothetical protein
MPSGARTAYACTRCYPQKNSSPWPDDGVFLSGWALGVPPCHCRLAHRPDTAHDGQGVVRMERMAAKTGVLSVTPTAAPGLCAGSILAQAGGRRPPAPLARELGRYAVAGGLASSWTWACW